jgi:hypothetical protein
MLDNLRDDTSSSYYNDEETVPPEEAKALAKPRRKANGKFLGMTPAQRFIVAVMLMIAVCAFGTMCLLLTNKIGLTF